MNSCAIFRWLILLGLGVAGAFGADRLMAAQPVSGPPDDQLYYRRTHEGAWPPAGVNSADHAGETTNTSPAAAAIPASVHASGVAPQGLLDNNVNPASLGKGDWIWQMSTTMTHLGVTTVQQVVDYEKNLGMQWITVKCGDGGSIYSQFSSDLITRAHAAGLKIFGWAYAYGNNTGAYGNSSTQAANINGEINVAKSALNLGADGFIIDAEIEYETNVTRRADATTYATSIRAAYPTRFLAHAPFPYIQSHSGFPYLEFGTNCDAVMPQDYWGAIGISPTTMVVNMNSQWRSWQNSLTGFNTNAIKPIVPLGQSYAPVTGGEITAFLNCLQTNTPKATAAGYAGVSFWDAQERTTDMDSAVAAAVIGSSSNLAPYLISQPVLNPVCDPGASVSFPATAGGAAPLVYAWKFNGISMPGATNSQLSLTNVQPVNAGFYTVTVTNTNGSVTSSPVGLLVYPPQATVFADTFDTDSSANWMVNRSSSDTGVAFNFDYSKLGIPSAPHATGGTTRGVQMKANLTLGVVAALSISPTNQSFAGDYRLHFDGWINANGPFPGGGVSSTEFLTAGLGTTGKRTEWTGAGSTADGYYFSADGDGGVANTSTTSGDYCLYSGATLLSYTTGDYVAGTDTAARDNLNTYYLTAFPTGAAAPAVQQTTYTQQSGTLNAGTLGLGWHDFMISRRGTTVDWSVDGYRIATISNCTFTASNVCVGFWDPFASLTDNTNLSFGLVDNVRVEVPAVAPVIAVQPTNVAVKVAGTATLAVTGSGLPVPGYQWAFKGTPIVGATNASLTLLNVQTNQAGNYAVTLTNVAGAVTSASVSLTLLTAAPAQFQAVTELPNQTLQLSGSGDAGGYYYLETSTDLAHWTPVATLVATNGIFQYNTGAVTNDAQRYFRARSGP